MIKLVIFLLLGLMQVQEVASGVLQLGREAAKKAQLGTAADLFFNAMFNQTEKNNIDEVYSHLVSTYRALGKEEDAYIRLGMAYRQRQQVEFAKKMSAKALEVNSHSASAHMLAAEIWLSDEVRKESSETETRERLTHLQLAVQYGSTDTDILFRAGGVLWGLKAYALSKDFYSGAYALNKSMLDASVISIYERNMLCDVSLLDRIALHCTALHFMCIANV